MKTTIKNIFIVAVIASTIIGCLPDPLDIKNVPELTPHIVVSSQVIPGQSIAVLLTKSISALVAGNGSNADTLLNSVVINDAVVIVTSGNKSDTLTFVGTGVYSSINVPLVDGAQYGLLVKSPTMGTVTSITTMKAFVGFDTVTTKLYESGRDTLLNVSYQFTDPPGKNWYMIDVQKLHSAQRLSDNLNPRVFVKPMTDDAFEGKVQSETFSVPFRRFSVGDTVAVTIANISEEYYTYIKQRVDDRNSISAFVSEPLNLPSNVQNGYGYFNMQVPDTRIFKMK